MFQKIKSYFVFKDGSLQKVSINTKLFTTGFTIASIFGLILYLSIVKDEYSPDNTPGNMTDKMDGHTNFEARENSKTDYKQSPSSIKSFSNLYGLIDHNKPDKKDQNLESSSNQIITNVENYIPTGSLIKVKLGNKLDSRTLNQPVIAYVLEDYVHNDIAPIPEESKLIGSAFHDDKAKRVQIQFHTIVYPNQIQKPISGIALDLKDSGTSGLQGEYISDKWKAYTGKFFSKFTAGLAKGMQDKDETQFGRKQKGTIENGILEGLSESMMEEADRYNDELKTMNGYILINPEYPFTVYLDKPFQLDGNYE